MNSLLEQQRESIVHLNNWSVGALFMEAGTGKTRVASELIKRSSCDFVLYICPLRTIENARKELDKWGVNLLNFHFVGVESIGMSDRIYLEVRSLLNNAHSPYVVVDESLKIKNFDAKRTKRVIDLGSLAKYNLILNGTPLSKSLEDLYPQMLFLSPLILNMTASKFKNTFCKYTTITKTQGKKRYSKEFITGYENIDYLYSLIRHYVFECDLNLNISQCYKVLKYEIGEESKDIYYELKEKYLDDETLQFKNNNIFLEMTSKMQHAYCVDKGKFKVLDELFKNVEQSKSIIFCRFIISREECAWRYPQARVLSYQKEALGLNLQDYNTTIYFDKIWDYALRVQASRRTFRTGQELDCRYYDLTGDVGLESLIDKNIYKKVMMTEYFKGKTKEELKEIL